MNTRNEWTISNLNSDIYNTASETVASVVSNFNIRLHSAEGVSGSIDGTTERFIVQDHSNPLNEGKTDKKIHVSISSILKTGSIVVFEGEEKWLCTSRINSVGGAYKSARIDKCNYNLKFINSSGQIDSRWCIVNKPSGDITETQYIATGSSQYYIELPFDIQTKFFQKDKRFLIDYNVVEPLAYKIVRVDRVTDNYGEGGGKIGLLVEEDGRNTVNDSLEHMIADYYSEYNPSPPTPTANYASIEYSGSLVLYYGSASKTFYSKYYNSEGVLLTVQPTSVWTVTLSDPLYNSYVQKTISTDTTNIKLKILDSRLIGMTITLNVSSSDATMTDSKTISIMPLG